MKAPKYYLALSLDEYRLLFASLIRFKNKLIAQGKYSEATDEVIFKLAKAK
jgi:hypothetical protein